MIRSCRDWREEASTASAKRVRIMGRAEARAERGEESNTCHVRLPPCGVLATKHGAPTTQADQGQRASGAYLAAYSTAGYWLPMAENSELRGEWASSRPPRRTWWGARIASLPASWTCASRLNGIPFNLRMVARAKRRGGERCSAPQHWRDGAMQIFTARVERQPRRRGAKESRVDILVTSQLSPRILCPCNSSAPSTQTLDMVMDGSPPTH